MNRRKFIKGAAVAGGAGPVAKARVGHVVHVHVRKELLEREVVLLEDGQERSLVGLRPDQVCRAGLSRTFQTIRLFPKMSVIENVLVGMHTTLLASTASAALRSESFRNEESAAWHTAWSR